MRAKPVLLALFLGANLISIPGPSLAQQGETAALTVAVAKPSERLWPETVPASGWLKPWHEAVIAAEIDGLRVTDVFVDVGSVVSKGQALIQLADDTVRAELRKEEASLAGAKADFAKARSNADRARKVKGSGALSDEKITEYLIAEQIATAGLESAEALMEIARIKLAKTTILAPDDGLITTRSAQLGTVVSSGMELFRLIRQQRVEWRAEVSARNLPRIRQGLTATIVGPGNKHIKGTVRLVGPTISADTGRAIAYVRLPSIARSPVGLYVTGQIELETTTALTVPETALVLRDGIAYVFTVGSDQRAMRVRVETGRRSGGEVEILSGLNRAAEVITTGGAFLSDKAAVRVEREALVQSEEQSP